MLLEVSCTKTFQLFVMRLLYIDTNFMYSSMMDYMLMYGMLTIGSNIMQFIDVIR